MGVINQSGVVIGEGQECSATPKQLLQHDLQKYQFVLIEIEDELAVPNLNVRALILT